MTETPGIYNVGGDRTKTPQLSIQQIAVKLDRLAEQVNQLTARIDQLILLIENQVTK